MAELWKTVPAKVFKCNGVRLIESIVTDPVCSAPCTMHIAPHECISAEYAALPVVVVVTGEATN